MANYAIVDGAGRPFAVNLCEVGDCNSCMYAFFCPGCAAAEARSMMDGSSCCFNFFAISMPINRWLFRSAYGIGNPLACQEDCLKGTFCCCCTANQLYQTAKMHGNPTTNGGRAFNVNMIADTSTQWSIGNVLYFGCCPCMAYGDAMQRAVGMPWWLGCLCSSYCGGRNILRYHHRVAPMISEEKARRFTHGICDADLLEECGAYYGGACLLHQCLGGATWIVMTPVNIFITAQVTAESHTSRARPTYFTGYRTESEPIIASEYVSPMVPIHGVVHGVTMSQPTEDMVELKFRDTK